MVAVRVGTRNWLGLIALCWGLCCCSLGFAENAQDFYASRFALGAAEAGFFPAVNTYLRQFVPADHFSTAYGLIISATCSAMVLGGPLAAAVSLLVGPQGATLAGVQVGRARAKMQRGRNARARTRTGGGGILGGGCASLRTEERIVPSKVASPPSLPPSLPSMCVSIFFPFFFSRSFSSSSINQMPHAAEDGGRFAAWQWLFLAQGLPAVLLGAMLPWLLPATPRMVAFKGDSAHQERKLYLALIDAQQSEK